MSLNRRSFFTWGTAGLAALSSAIAVSLGGVVRFLTPSVFYEPPQSFEIGNPADFSFGPPTFLTEQKIYVFRDRGKGFAVASAVCTHLGCSPLGAFEPNNAYQVAGTDLGANWPGGFYCPCHGSKYDISGRVFKSMPAPKNLTVPPYAFSGDARIVIGEDEAPKST